MSTRSRSESSFLGVPATSSGAMTEIVWSALGRVSSPPTGAGRAGRPCVLPDEALNSGVSESLRLIVPVKDFRGLFWPARVLGIGGTLGAAAGAFCDFLVGASGAGHSTSWDKSRREAGTHSEDGLAYSLTSIRRRFSPSSRLLNSS